MAAVKLLTKDKVKERTIEKLLNQINRSKALGKDCSEEIAQIKRIEND